MSIHTPQQQHDMSTLPTPEPSPIGPCPFCRAENAVVLTLTEGMYIVQCGCSAQGPWAQTPALAVAAWQSRGVLPWRTCPACRRHFIPKTRRQIYDSRRCAWRGWSHNKRLAQAADASSEPHKVAS